MLLAWQLKKGFVQEQYNVCLRRALVCADLLIQSVTDCHILAILLLLAGTNPWCLLLLSPHCHGATVSSSPALDISLN